MPDEAAGWLTSLFKMSLLEIKSRGNSQVKINEPI